MYYSFNVRDAGKKLKSKRWGKKEIYTFDLTNFGGFGGKNNRSDYLS